MISKNKRFVIAFNGENIIINLLKEKLTILRKSNGKEI